MDTKFQTSFIPRKPINGPAISRSGETVSFFTVIAVVIFALTAAGAIGIFFYERYLSKDVEAMTESLNAAEAALNSAEIANWTRLDSRIENAKVLMSTHVALSAFFDVLSKMTLKSMRFKNFSYTLATGGKINISMNGEADSFATVALQSDEFAKYKDQLTDQMFSNLDLAETGDVTFNFSTTVSPDVVSYRNLVLPDSQKSSTTTAPLIVPSGSTTTRSVPATGNFSTSTGTSTASSTARTSTTTSTTGSSTRSNRTLPVISQ